MRGQKWADPAAMAWIDMLGDDDVRRRTKANAELRNLGFRALPALLHRQSDPDPARRRAVAKRIGALYSGAVPRFLTRAATLAEAWFVPLAPHSSSTLLGLTASLHATASIPLFLIHEGGQGHDPSGVVKKTWEVDQDGYASLPQGPGLGVEIDEEKVRSIDAAPQKPYRWPSGKYPDGSVADY